MQNFVSKRGAANGSWEYFLEYDAENRLVKVCRNTSPCGNDANLVATFTYDGDGNRVKSVIGCETTYFVGGHYEGTNPGSGQTVTKYYFAGGQRVAMRKYTIPQSMAVEYLISTGSTRRLGDHLGSTSLTTGSTRAKVCGISKNDHRIPKGIKAVAFLYCSLIRLKDPLPPRERADQHQQC